MRKNYIYFLYPHDHKKKNLKFKVCVTSGGRKLIRQNVIFIGHCHCHHRHGGRRVNEAQRMGFNANTAFARCRALQRGVGRSDHIEFTINWIKINLPMI